MKPKGLPEILGEMARRGARLTGQNGVNCGRMCSDCAFKPNQPQTEEFLNAAEAAFGCLQGRGTFRCHEKDHSADNGLPCMGFWYAQQCFALFENQEE